MTLRFKTYIPKLVSPDVFTENFMRTANEVAHDVHDDFDKVTNSWRNVPKFEEEVKDTGKAVELSVMTDSMIFRYYDQGNGGPERIIKPVNSSVLHWVDDGGQDVFVKYVHGYEGRKAVEKIEADWEKKMPPRFEQAMREAVKASGHSI